MTGAASGMGLAMAHTFANSGMKVVLADIEDDVLKQVTTELNEAGHDVIGVRTDVEAGGGPSSSRTNPAKVWGRARAVQQRWCRSGGTSGKYFDSGLEMDSRYRPLGSDLRSQDVPSSY